MSINSSHKISPLEPLGGLQRIRLNPVDASFCVFLVIIWSELCYRSALQFYGFTPALTTESIICDWLRFILSTATNTGLNIVKNIELGHDISIFHKVTVPSNDCESFALTALFALCFFSLRQFIGQGVIFLITPAFDYYVELSLRLLEAVVDEIMYPAHVVAGMHRHRQQVTPLSPTPLPSPIKTRETCPTFQPTLSFSSGAGLSTPRNKAIQRNKPSPNSARPASLSPSAAPSRSYRLDESPLNREEMRLYIAVAGMKSALTIQSQPKYRGFFRMDMPLYLAEREPRVDISRSDSEKAPGQDALRDDSEAIILGSTKDTTTSVPDVVSHSTFSAEMDALPMEVSPLPPIVNLVVEDAPDSSPSMLLVSNSLVMPDEEGESRLVPTPAPAPAPLPAFTPAPAPAPPLKALDKGKGRVRTSNLFIPKPQIRSTPLQGNASAPKVPLHLSNSTLPAESSQPEAEIPVVPPPRAPTPPAASSQPTPPASVPSPSSSAPPALDKGKGRVRTSNLFIPKPQMKSATLYGTTSAPMVPSRLSNSTLPAESSLPEAEIPVVAPPRAPTPPAASSQPTPPAPAPSTSSPAPQALYRGQGRVRTSNLFIPKPQMKSAPLHGNASAPKVLSRLSNPTLPAESSPSEAEASVVAPPRTPTPPTPSSQPTPPAPAPSPPSPAPSALDKGKGREMSPELVIPQPQTESSPPPSIASVPETPSCPSDATPLEDSSSPVTGVPIGTPASISSPAMTPTEPTAPVSGCLGSPIVQQPQAPDSALDADGDSLMVDDFYVCIGSIETQVNAVSSVETMVGMEETLAPPEPETTATASDVPSSEPSQGIVDSEESMLVEPAAETEATDVTMGERLVPQQAELSTLLFFAIPATASFVLPNAQSGPPTQQIQPAANTSMIDTDENFTSLNPSQTQTSLASGVSRTHSDEKEAQTKSLAASGSTPLVTPRHGEMRRVRRFSSVTNQPTKKSAAADLSDIGYIPIRLLDEEDILPKENGGDSEFEDDD